MSSDSCIYSRENGRGQSETLGFILLFAMVLIGAGTVVTFGAAALDSSEESLSADRAEKVMTQMDSEISMVALGRTDSQHIQFDRASGEKFSVDEEAGQVNITTVGDDSTVILPDTTLGAVKFERDDVVIAYQGGGVWRSDGAGSGMVSPPEFNYRDRTLTLPLVTVTGDNSLDRSAVIRKNGPSESYFPNPENQQLSNPLEDEIVQVTVETEFHHGWRNYFETRTEGEVTHEPENQRVTVNLTAAAVVDFEHGAATTGMEPPKSQGSGEIVGSTRTNLTAESASPDIEERINDCEDEEIVCTEVTDDWSENEDVASAGTYYADDNLDIKDDIELDTSDGDIEIVVDGTLTIQSGNDVIISGDNQVRFYVRGDEGEKKDVDIRGSPDTGDDPESLVILVHSEADTVETGGGAEFNGYIYAPNSEFDNDGGTNIEGGIVAEEIDMQTGTLTHVNPSFQLEVGEGVNALTFLHISTNPVAITGN